MLVTLPSNQYVASFRKVHENFVTHLKINIITLFQIGH